MCHRYACVVNLLYYNAHKVIILQAFNYLELSIQLSDLLRCSATWFSADYLL